MTNTPLKDIQDIDIKGRYETLKKDREQLEATWKDCAKLTLPYLFPDIDHQESNNLPTPYNSVGALGVNNLGSKLLFSILPPTSTFFRLIPYEESMKDLSEDEKTALDEKLLQLETEVNELISLQALRVPLFEAMKLLVVTGNALLYKVPKSGLKVFNPYEYVVKRDFIGNVFEIVIQEKITPVLLDQETLSQVMNNNSQFDPDTDVDIYTYVRRVDSQNWEVIQEVEGVKVNSSYKKFKDEVNPYLVLRWTAVFNEDYGRGLVEQYLGDLRTLEGITQMITESAGVAAKTVFGVRPSATTDVEDLVNAENGDVIVGDLEKDVTVLRVQKGMDYQVPFQLMQQVEQRLSKAFMLIQDAIRDSERTTAAEVRIVANEIETTLGGTFSTLSQDLQKPLLTLLLHELDPKALKIAMPSIVAGLSSISREKEYQNLTIFLQTIAGLGGEVIAKYLKVNGYLEKIALSLGIQPEDVVKSDKEIQQEQQQQMQAQQAMQQQQMMQQQGGGLNG